jgi:hypothetical protein
METLTSSPLLVKNGAFSEKFSLHASYFSPAGFSEKATKGCHTFVHGEAILFAPLFPHSPFSENPFSDLREGVTTPNVAFLLAPKLMGHVIPPPTIFKRWQFGGEANPCS